MYLIRAIAGFILIFIGFIGVAAAFFTNPIAIAIPLITIPLALYIMGYISTFAPAKAHIKHKEQQKEITGAPSYKYRSFFTGIFALILGTGGIYAVYKSGNGLEDAMAAAGSLMFLIIGIFIIYGHIFGEKGLAALGIKLTNKDKDIESVRDAYMHCMRTAKELPQVMIGVEQCKGEMVASLLERNGLTWSDIEYHVNNDTGMSKYLKKTRKLLNNYGRDMPGAVDKIDAELSKLVIERFPGR